MADQQESDRDAAGRSKSETGQQQGRSANQVTDEPTPASHHEGPRQAAVVRNEQSSGESAPAEAHSSRDGSGEAPRD